MRFPISILVLGITVITCSAVAAQDTAEINLLVGKSSDNSYTKGKEAEVIGTFPDSTDAKHNWLTNAFVEFGITTTSSRWSFGLTGELHRNTLIDKEKDLHEV